jgi:hypothetical protein
MLRSSLLTLYMHHWLCSVVHKQWRLLALQFGDSYTCLHQAYCCSNSDLLLGATVAVMSAHHVSD